MLAFSRSVALAVGRPDIPEDVSFAALLGPGRDFGSDSGGTVGIDAGAVDWTH